MAMLPDAITDETAVLFESYLLVYRQRTRRRVGNRLVTIVEDTPIMAQVGDRVLKEGWLKKKNRKGSCG
jgi:hypothetical protein